MRKKFFFTLIIIFWVILALVLVLYFYQFHGKLSDIQRDWGAFGEYFAGTFGTVISLLALIGLIFSIEITKRQFKKQSEESTFFNLLNLHINKVNNLVLDEKYQGYNAFYQYLRLVKAEVRKLLINDARFRYVKQPSAISNRAATLFGQCMNKQFPTIPAFHNFSTQHCTTKEEKIVIQYLLDRKEKKRDETIKAAFKEDVSEELYNIGLGYFMDYSLKEKSGSLLNIFQHFYDDYGQFFGHYFRNMHHILRYVKTTEKAEEYIMIYRAQLSRFELSALFYNYMGSNAGSDFISNIYEMKIFKGIYTPDLFFTPTQDEFKQLIKYRYDHAKKTR